MLFYSAPVHTLIIGCTAESFCAWLRLQEAGNRLIPNRNEFMMKTIQVFDPALCCSSGVCGAEVDQALVTFSADIGWATQQGARIERFNLAQQPLAFAQNDQVKGFLERSGAEALPLILVDGDIALAGRYPSRAELARWVGIVQEEAAPATPCCSGGKCG